MMSRPALTQFSEEEDMLRDTVHKFAQQHLAPKVSSMDRAGELDADVLPALFDCGLMGIEIPEAHGGMNMTFTQSVIAIEELAKVDPTISVIADIQNTLINTAFRTYASPEQQAEWLPRLATDTVGSFCLSEAGSGSDAFALKTTAEKKGAQYVINGSKLWISNAKEAGVFVVFANVRPELRYKGITSFIVPAGTPGLTVAKKEDKLGIRASSTCEVVFEDVAIPEANRIGEEGEGYRHAIGLLNEGRIGIGAQMVGLAQGAYEVTMPYLFQRKQFDQQIGTFQGMQHQYAQARTDIEAARLLVYNAARLKEAGAPFRKEAAMSKLYAAQVAERVASKCVEWCGGVGFTKEFPQEKFFRDAKIGAIYEGTHNLMLSTIAGMIQKEYQ